MHDRVVRNLGARVGDEGFTTDEINFWLDHIYQHEIPDRVSKYREGMLALPLVQGTETYDLAAQTKTLNGTVFTGVRSRIVTIDGNRLYYFSDPLDFYEANSDVSTNQATPDSVLIDGGQATFRPVPSAVKTAKLWINQSRAAFTTEVDNEIEALALVDGATFFLGAEHNMGEQTDRFLALYNARVNQLQGQALRSIDQVVTLEHPY